MKFLGASALPGVRQLVQHRRRRVVARKRRAARRPMSERERAVLDLLLSADFPEADDLSRQAESAVAIDGCGCGCPSIDFDHPDVGPGLRPVVNAMVRGTNDGMFLFMVGPHLGGIEYVPIDEPMASEFPDASQIELY